MRNHQTHKAIVLVIGALCLAGSLGYWVHERDAVKTASSNNRYHVTPDDRSKSNVLSFDRDPGEAANPFPHRASPGRSDHPVGHGVASESVRTFAELAQEIRARSPENKEADLFLQIANLATGHPDAQVREQGIAYLARSEDERAVVFLITALLDTEFHIRQLSLNALFQSGKSIPVQPLIEFALKDAGAMRAQVVALIGQVAGAGSDEVLQLEAQLQDQ